MRFLIDAQLPGRLCEILINLGIEAIHVDSLPQGDETLDSEIITYADKKKLTVMTKDSDFYHSHILYGKPQKLFMIQTGNMKNRELFNLLRKNIETIKTLMKTCIYLELTEEGVFGH